MLLTVVETEADYNRYLREHTYHILCEEATIRTVKQHDEKLIKEKDALSKKLDEAADLFLSMDDTTTRLQKEYDALESKYSKSVWSHTRTRRLLLLAVVLLMVFSILTASDVISFGTRAPVRTYDQGYAAGQADQEADAGLYEQGYAAGKDEGYNDGYYKGYWEGYADAGERSQGSGDSRGSSSGQHTGTGSHRDTLIADAYIENKNSHKFHLPTCSYLPDANHQTTFDSREDAISAGYSPCGHCNP